MRIFTLIFCVTFLFSITSCSKDNCIDDILGTYAGTESCQFIVFNISITLSSSGSNDILITVPGSTAMTGSLDSSCNIITIQNQSVTSGRTNQIANGFLNINNDNMTGTITWSTGAVCDYNLNR